MLLELTLINSSFYSCSKNRTCPYLYRIQVIIIRQNSFDSQLMLCLWKQYIWKVMCIHVRIAESRSLHDTLNRVRVLSIITSFTLDMSNNRNMIMVIQILKVRIGTSTKKKKKKKKKIKRKGLG
jgi:hypothetical protein